MARALLSHEETKALGEILSGWNFKDDTNLAAPTIFHSVYRKFALKVFADELGEELAKTMLSNWYFWQERLQQMVLAGESTWFDDISTKSDVETADKLFFQAGFEAKKELTAKHGKDPKKWQWGKAHTIEFLSPIRRKGLGKGLLGGGEHPAPGSVDTLHRGKYSFDGSFGVTVSDSLRMVADLSDEDKVLAVLPGGVAGRVFYPHTTDQIKAFMNGEIKYWWFSDSAIKKHNKNVLVINPK